MKPITKILIVIAATVLFSCRENEQKTVTVTTFRASSISESSYYMVISGGIVRADDNTPIKSRGIIWDSKYPITIDTYSGKTNEGSGTGAFVSQIKDENIPQIFYVRAYATSGNRIYYGETISSSGQVVSGGETEEGETEEEITTVTDIDGNKYNTVKIGNQTWFKENLRTTKYNDGTRIPNVTGNSSWSKLSTPAYCWLNNDISYKPTYGALYNWYAVATGKLCPKGWHVPTDREWNTLIDFAGGENQAGKKLKAKTGWETNTGTDNYGFSALPGGFRFGYGYFTDYTERVGIWWSSSTMSSNPYRLYLVYDASYASFNFYEDLNVGFSVRCIKNK